MTAPEVQHLTEAQRFEIQVEGHTALLKYTLVDAVMTITHTFVPEALRGQRIAGMLAAAAFQFAQDTGKQVIPQCSYIATYAQRHPEAAALIVGN